MNAIERIQLYATVFLVVVDSLMWALYARNFWMALLWPIAGLASILFNKWSESTPIPKHRRVRR